MLVKLLQRLTRRHEVGRRIFKDRPRGDRMKPRLRRRDLGGAWRLEEGMQMTKLVVQMSAHATVGPAAMSHGTDLHRPAGIRAAGMAATRRCDQQHGDKEETIRHRLLASA